MTRFIPTALLLSILIAGPAALASEAGELDITAVREGKKDVLFLIGGEIVMLGKWPLRLHVFDTGGLEGCSLAYSAEILDLEQIKIRREDTGPVLVCGKTRAAGRAASEVRVSEGAVGTERRQWTATSAGASLRLHLRSPGEPEWTVSFRRP